MGRKLPFLPTCGSPTKTLSFRAAITGELHDMAATEEAAESSIESVIRGLSTDRFFFKPGKTSSILEEAKAEEKEKEKQVSVLPFKESVSMMEIESTDPFVDFKKSMQEMVEADEGFKGWENLQELLSWYLAVNEKINHGYIIGAFVDLLLVNLGSSPSSTSSSSCSSSSLSSINAQDQSLLMGSGCNKKKMISSESPESALSFTSSSASSSGTCSSTSHCLSSCSLEEEEEEEEEEEDGDDNHGDDEDDHNSAQKAAVSDDASS